MRFFSRALAICGLTLFAFPGVPPNAQQPYAESDGVCQTTEAATSATRPDPASFRFDAEVRPTEWTEVASDVAPLPPITYESLESRLQRAEAELASLRAQLQGPNPQQVLPVSAPGGGAAILASAPADVAKAGADSPSLMQRVTKLEDLFKSSQSKLPNVRLSGFFHFDTGLFSQDANSMATLGDIYLVA